MMPSPSVVRSASEWLATRARWHPLEFVFWGVAFAAYIVLPDRHLILTEIAWLGLFALSLDLILGYAGIISLGHAAFLGSVPTPQRSWPSMGSSTSQQPRWWSPA